MYKTKDKYAITTELFCSKCGYCYSIFVGYNFSLNILNIGKTIKEEVTNKKCPICNNYVKPSNIKLDTNNELKFDIQNPQKNATFDWVCSNCGLTKEKESIRYENLKELQLYIAAKKTSLQNNGCLCGKHLITHKNFKSTLTYQQ